MRLTWLLLPLLIYAAAVIAVDPFRFFDISSLIPIQVKEGTSGALNICILKMVDFRRHPKPNLLLGDSRMLALTADKVSAVTGRPFANMAYGGGSLNEMADTFWFANSLTRLKEVWIGLGFHLYNDYNYTTRTEPFLAMEKNPLLYFTNRTVVESMAYNVYYAYKGGDSRIDRPLGTKEEMWRASLAPLTTQWYTRYVYPTIYRKQLREIADYCQKNGIRLGFIIFPTHVDLQRRAAELGVQGYYDEFKKEMPDFGLTYDYDFPNAMTEDKGNFSDPYHFTAPIADAIIRQVWMGAPYYGKRLDLPGQ